MHGSRRTLNEIENEEKLTGEISRASHTLIVYLNLATKLWVKSALFAFKMESKNKPKLILY
jgi:hypothetical protein